MKIIVVKDSKDVGAKAAELVVKEIGKKKDLVLGLATGGTMIPFYRSLADLIHQDLLFAQTPYFSLRESKRKSCVLKNPNTPQTLVRGFLTKRKKIDFSGVKSFNLDEYVGLSKNDKGSYYYFMNKNFFSKVAMLEKNVNFLDGMAKNLDLECRDYEKNIGNAGGIDLQILGIGRDGHIGFNEPGSGFKSRTREVLLSKVTRKDNSRFFSSINKVPRRALTMGIGTIMSAKKIILLASGGVKAGIVHRALHGKISEDVPASILQKHKNVILILDKTAASELD